MTADEAWAAFYAEWTALVRAGEPDLGLDLMNAMDRHRTRIEAAVIDGLVKAINERTRYLNWMSVPEMGRVINEYRAAIRAEPLDVERLALAEHRRDAHREDAAFLAREYAALGEPEAAIRAEPLDVARARATMKALGWDFLVDGVRFSPTESMLQEFAREYVALGEPKP